MTKTTADDSLHQRFEQLVDFFWQFDEHPQERPLSDDDPLGHYYQPSEVPASLRHMYNGISHLQRQGHLEGVTTVVDAGSGDGRVAALFALFGFRVLGIEAVGSRLDHSETLLHSLHEDGVINADGVSFVHGNFLNSTSYDGVTLGAETVVFNYFAGYGELSRSMGAQQGTRLLLYNHGNPYPQQLFDFQQVARLDRSLLEPAPITDERIACNLYWNTKDPVLQLFK